ncbi:acetyl-CoA carboxylase biotin carboxylase subunit [soil metagenome]
MSFEKILIANRGEIACRVITTARRLGYRTVAVFSDADANARHVTQADEAVHLGASPAADSYLNIAKLLDAARRSGADAVHPGYGFLSEQADFAQAVIDAGLVFIGPPPAAITAMGNKAGAKRRMGAAGVPCAPGYLGEDQSDAGLSAEARKLGLPLLVKAVAGGGGRGMRLVRDWAELAEALAGARREAESAFGDATLMLERLIEPGRHIEIQIFADAQGRAIHLGERDCSTQRRRQKVIEEAPSPLVSAALRERMGADAVAAALAVGYRGAGTVEFIVDAGTMQHYFLEMNTRLQVEHPVTEAISGLDLVEWQLRIAAGEALPLTQSQVRFEGHAIEVRLYAEDPYSGFAPQTGRVLHWRPDESSVRIDSGIAEGGTITPYYDPLLAKLIAHGRDRADAIRRLRAALQDTPLLGIAHNGGFLRDLLDHPAFRSAALHTGTLDQWAVDGDAVLQAPVVPEVVWRLAAALFAGPATARPASVANFDLSLRARGEQRTLRVPADSGIRVLSRAGHEVRFIDGQGVQRRAVVVQDAEALHIALDGHSVSVREVSAWPVAAAEAAGADALHARAPVAGSVVAIKVAIGERVIQGQPLVCVEAMKMEMWLNAGGAGTVKAIHVALKDTVAAGALLVELEEITP